MFQNRQPPKLSEQATQKFRDIKRLNEINQEIAILQDKINTLRLEEDLIWRRNGNLIEL